MHVVDVKDPDGHAISCRFNKRPDSCPICHRSVEPSQRSVAVFVGRPSSQPRPLEIVFQCPSAECSRLFIGGYYPVDPRARGRDLYYVLRRLCPTEVEQPSTPEDVQAVSKSFHVIHYQAFAAESFGLDQVAGPGYRKALEFLVKDYCVSLDPSSAEAIKKEPLAQCIQNRVSDPRVKECARCAAWLGNDVTHYVRRWEEKDIEDLKILIQLTVNWIHSAVLTQRYSKDLPAKPA